eukprot:CAMPEP_0197442602 /NCGR_PEP_ID=MMETSP1175-20131217/8582_1 /TAXON_ID=1003142 /ORGANISM="Triceratium dubium, Strain CCMP147" /LENGTH=65 /DNA_ID=CAMNT_0042973111 /DNA_START=37 /DNA_END=231 /DNA_ORIENTATION=-
MKSSAPGSGGPGGPSSASEDDIFASLGGSLMNDLLADINAATGAGGGIGGVGVAAGGPTDGAGRE